MPKDVDLARELAEKINTEYTGKIKNVEFTYNTQMDLVDIPNEPLAWLSIDNDAWERVSRGDLRRDTVIKLTVISRQGVTDDAAWIDDQLESYDMLMDYLDNVELGPKNLKVLSIDTDERYDAEMFHNNKRLLTEALITIRNV